MLEKKNYEISRIKNVDYVSAGSSHVTTLIKKGTKKYQNKFFKDTLKNYDRQISSNPKSTVSLWNKALFLAEFGKTDKELKCYNKILKIHPKDTDALYNKAILFEQSNRRDKASVIYRKILKINPKYVSALLNLGETQLEQGDLKVACRLLDKALRLDKKDPVTWYNKGQALQKLGRSKEALKHYDTAIKFLPNAPGFWFSKAMMHFELEDFDSAFFAINEGLKLDPSDNDARVLRATITGELGERAEILTYQEFLKKNPRDDVTWFNLGNSYGNLDRISEAKNAYKKSIKNNPSNISALTNLSIILFEHEEKYKQALNIAQSILKIDPEDAHGWNMLAQCLDNLGKPKQALIASTKGLKYKPKDSHALFNRGLILTDLKKSKEAIHCFKKASLLDPNDPEKLDSIAEELFDLKEYQIALNYAEKSTKLNPANDEAWYTKACIHSLLKNTDEALDALTVSIALEPENKILARDDEDLKNIQKTPKFKKLVSNTKHLKKNSKG